jgi:hypothetical protein
MRFASPTLLLALGAAATTAACGEAAIEMRLELPTEAQTSGFSASCITAVEVFVLGTDRGIPPKDPSDPGQPADDLYECLEISDVASYRDVRREIAGRFSLALPASGLAGVDVRGSTGSCNKVLSPGDPIFYASARYKGGDSLVLPMMPNLSCDQTRRERVRPVDLLALTRTRLCPGPLPDTINGGVDSGTIHPFALSEAVFDAGDTIGAMVGNVASLPLYVTNAESSCVALVYGDKDKVMTTASCVRRGLGVCTDPKENLTELPIIDGNLAFQAATVATIDQYGGWVIGGVWGFDANGNKVPLAGATIAPAPTADAEKAKIVYAELPADLAHPREVAGATKTDASGLFIAYVGRPMDFVVSAFGYRDETVRMGSPGGPSTALILLTKR